MRMTPLMPKLLVKTSLSCPISGPQLYEVQLVAAKLVDISIKQASIMGGQNSEVCHPRCV